MSEIGIEHLLRQSGSLGLRLGQELSEKERAHILDQLQLRCERVLGAQWPGLDIVYADNVSDWEDRAWERTGTEREHESAPQRELPLRLTWQDGPGRVQLREALSDLDALELGGAGTGLRVSLIELSRELSERGATLIAIAAHEIDAETRSLVRAWGRSGAGANTLMRRRNAVLRRSQSVICEAQSTSSPMRAGAGDIDLTAIDARCMTKLELALQLSEAAVAGGGGLLSWWGTGGQAVVDAAVVDAPGGVGALSPA